jgi:hypothetical protein
MSWYKKADRELAAREQDPDQVRLEIAQRLVEFFRRGTYRAIAWFCLLGAISVIGYWHKGWRGVEFFAPGAFLWLAWKFRQEWVSTERELKELRRDLYSSHIAN